ncbi:MAG: DUF3373 family protein [Sulfuricurvum sp.]|nr:DUF3373 family protein [Sulfuricurvum sp.]
MKQRFLGSIVAAALLSTAAIADDTLMQRFDKMEKEMAALKAELNTLKAQKAESAQKTTIIAAPVDKTVVTSNADVAKEIDDIKDQLSNINRKTNGNNLKFGVDFRTSVDNLQYKMADGSKQKNDALFSNRLWLNMNYAATKKLSFTGQLAYNKTFGQRAATTASSGMEGFDWISSEAAYNDTLRVRSAYFFYQDNKLAGLDVPWTVSIGRRPSTEGHLINLRDDVKASSPLAHTVNVEFDGASAKFGMEEITGLDGSYFKLCAGRGMSEAEPRMGSSAPYAGEKSVTNNIDMAGLILVPYDDKQYSVGMQYTYANNLIDLANPGVDYSMKTVGGLHTATAFVMANGIGDKWSDFLDDTTIFVSGAMSKTDPYANGKGGMLGSTDSQTGYSYWIGTQFPSLISDEGRWGAEFNHGSQYWRPITYGEDTLIGSKIAARGDAYELYFTEPLVDDILTFQLRYTYINYDYSGSNGFFGSTSGTPMSMDQARAYGSTVSSQVVDHAQDIRAYIRYKF